MTGLAGQDKPYWACLTVEAATLEAVASGMRVRALEVRCPATDSSGAQCTLDEGHEEIHRHRQEDLP